MKQKNYTVDEKFMLCLYEKAEQSGDMEARFDKYEIGKLAGLHPKGADAICKLLLRCNFIMKGDDLEVYLTPHGEKLVHTLRTE